MRLGWAGWSTCSHDNTNNVIVKLCKIQRLMENVSIIFCPRYTLCMLLKNETSMAVAVNLVLRRIFLSIK